MANFPIDTWSQTAGNNTRAVPDGAPNNWTGKDINDWGRETMAVVRSWYDDPEWLSITFDLPTRAAKGINKETSSTFRILLCDATAYYTAGRRLQMRGATTEYAHVLTSAVNGADTVVTIVGSNVPAAIVDDGVDVYFAKSLDPAAFVASPAVGDLRLTSGLPSAAAADGWEECNGDEYVVADYPALAALYGATGFADGYYDDPPNLPASSAGNFRVPDMRGQVPVGFWSGGDGDGDYDTIGGDYGIKEHPLVEAELAAHVHSAAGAHVHTLEVGTTGTSTSYVDRGSASGKVTTSAPMNSVGSHSHGSVGSGDEHETRQPSIVMGWVVYTGVIP